MVWSRIYSLSGDIHQMIVKPKKQLICTHCGKEINKNHLTTPVSTFIECEDYWNLKLNFDLCATRHNTKCNLFYDEKINFFNIKKLNPHFNYFENPPHDKTKFFVEHTYHLWKTSNCNIVVLLPINTLTSTYARKYILPFCKIQILTGRIHFLCNNCFKPTKDPSVNGYVSVLYAKK